MPTARTSISNLRPDITEAFAEFGVLEDQSQFIGYKVLPFFDVQLQRSTFPVIPLVELLQNSDTLRNNKSGYNMIDWGFEDASYATQEHGLAAPVDDRVRNIYANFFEAEVETAKLVRDRVLREAEKRVAAKVFNATTFTSQTTSVTNEWDSNHTSDAVPIVNVRTASNAVYDRTGLWPNALIINRKVYRNLRTLDEIVNAVESGGAGDPSRQRDITAQMLAQVFDLDYVFIAGGSANIENEGQDATIEQIWSSEYAMVARVATTNSFSEPCLGRTLHWSEDGSQPLGMVETYRDEQLRRDVVRVRHDVDEKFLYVAAAQLLDNVTTL